MLERLTETFIAGVELLEAEGRVARARLISLVATIVLVLVCGIGALLGLLATSVGLVWVLARAVGTGWALTIVGGVVLVTSAVVARVAVQRLKRPGPSPPVREKAADSEVSPEDEQDARAVSLVPTSTPALDDPFALNPSTIDPEPTPSHGRP